MNRAILLSFGIFAFFHSFAFATDTPLEPSDVISKEGQLVIADNDSTYTFKKDGTFELFPIAASGCWVKGTWKTRANNKRHIEIKGQWSWINGGSDPNDFRKMVLTIYPLSGEKERVRYRETEVYKCRFTIDEISKIPPESNSQTNGVPSHP